MLNTLARALPLACYAPFRQGAVRFRRGSLPRGACIAVLKLAARAHRAEDGSLARRLPEIRPADGGGLSFAASDSMVMDAVYWFGIQGYEGRVAEIWVALCRKSRAVLEVGGNVGLFSVIGATAQGAAGAYTVVEPVPEIAALLRANLRRNGLDKVVLHEAAVVPDAAPGTVRLNVPEEGRAAPVGAHLVDGSETGGRSTARLIEVAGLPFRDLVAGCDLVKIDAEGIEAALLTSARDLIAAARPTLLVEVLPEAEKLGALLAELAAECGYIVSVIPEWGSDTVVTVAPADFTAALPARHKSKDVLLSTLPLERILA